MHNKAVKTFIANNCIATILDGQLPTHGPMCHMAAYVDRIDELPEAYDVAGAPPHAGSFRAVPGIARAMLHNWMGLPEKAILVRHDSRTKGPRTCLINGDPVIVAAPIRMPVRGSKETVEVYPIHMVSGPYILNSLTSVNAAPQGLPAELWRD
jgi:hypothetical protein